MSRPNHEINDVRLQPQFRGFSFSNFKKTEVRTQLIENMKRGKVEPACYWAGELICAGHFLEVWETILYYFGKHIHLANPRMVIYIHMRYTIFRNIVEQGLYPTILHLRNHDQIRKLFAEVICNLTLCNKKPSFEVIKINRVEEFDMTQMTDRLKAPSVHYVDDIFRKEDPKELIIALNEFGFHISPEQRNMNSACYWIEWINDFDAICKTRKEPTRCDRRGYPVEPKYQRDIIWLIWDVLFQQSAKLDNPFISKAMQSTNELFCIKYTTASSKKRRYLLYFAVSILTETVNTNTEIVANKTVLESVLSQINDVYKQIKANEQSPNTEYLFNQMESETNFNKMVQKMEIVRAMDI
jgi:hypothetical protein